MEKFLSILERCPLFSGVSREDLSAVMGCIGGSVMEVGREQPVFLEGAPATFVGLVLEGAVRLERQDYYGNRSIIGYVGPTELFCETYACAQVAHLPISVIADVDSRVLLMDCARITTGCSGACSFHSRIIHNLLGMVATANLRYDQKIQITSRRSTREKLLAYLNSEAKRQGCNRFSIPYDRQELADYLEVDRSGLSAEISKLRKEGILECHKSEFILL